MTSFYARAEHVSDDSLDWALLSASEKRTYVSINARWLERVLLELKARRFEDSLEDHPLNLEGVG